MIGCCWPQRTKLQQVDTCEDAEQGVGVLGDVCRAAPWLSCVFLQLVFSLWLCLPSLTASCFLSGHWSAAQPPSSCPHPRAAGASEVVQESRCQEVVSNWGHLAGSLPGAALTSTVPSKAPCWGGRGFLSLQFFSFHTWHFFINSMHDTIHLAPVFRNSTCRQVLLNCL